MNRYYINESPLLKSAAKIKIGDNPSIYIHKPIKLHNENITYTKMVLGGINFRYNSHNHTYMCEDKFHVRKLNNNIAIEIEGSYANKDDFIIFDYLKSNRYIIIKHDKFLLNFQLDHIV